MARTIDDNDKIDDDDDSSNNNDDIGSDNDRTDYGDYDDDEYKTMGKKEKK